jgi:transcriptional regulator with XRE-family HTH domain
MDINKILSMNLVWFRKQKNMRQIDLAEKAKVSFRYYQDIECGKRNVTVFTLKRLANALDITVEDLTTLRRIELRDKCLTNFINSNTQKLKHPEIAFLIKGIDKKIVFACERFLQLHEVSLEQIIGKKIDSFFPNDIKEISSRIFGFLDKKHITNHMSYLTNSLSGVEINMIRLPLCLHFKDHCLGTLSGLVIRDYFNQSIQKKFHEVLESLEI